MSTPVLSEAGKATSEQAKAETETRIANANSRAASLIFGAQKLMFEEFVFASNEILERAQTEMHLFSEFASKMAAAHSVKDINTIYEECSKHQIEFVRRDSDRLFRHGEHVIEAAAKLLTVNPRS